MIEVSAALLERVRVYELRPFLLFSYVVKDLPYIYIMIYMLLFVFVCVCVLLLAKLSTKNNNSKCIYLNFFSMSSCSVEFPPRSVLLLTP